MGRSAEKRELRRAMGFLDLLLFFVITGFNVIWLPKAAEAGPVAITFWVLGGLAFYLPLALCVLELTSRHPGEGGIYIWTRQAFGDFPAFMCGWTYWTSLLPFFPTVLAFIAANALHVGGDRWQHLSANQSYVVGTSLLCLALVTVPNLVGLDMGKWVHNVGAVGTWLPALGLMVLACIAWSRHGSATEMPASSFVPHGSVRELILWSVFAASLTGVEAASILGDEIKDVRRIFPPALILGGLLCVVTFILGTLALLLVLPPQEVTGLDGFMEAFERAASRVGLGGLAPVVAATVVVGLIGKVAAWMAAGARLPFVAGLDRRLPAAFARIHPRWGTPYVSFLVQVSLTAALVLLGQAGTTVKGAYDVLMAMMVIPTIIPFLFLFAAMIRLQAETVGPEVTRVPGGRPVAIVLALLGFVSSLSFLVLSVIPPEAEPNKVMYVAKVVGLSIVLIAGGIGAYLTGRRRTDRSSHDS